MKLRVDELDCAKALDENAKYYTNLNPDDYIKAGGVNKHLATRLKI